MASSGGADGGGFEPDPLMDAGGRRDAGQSVDSGPANDAGDICGDGVRGITEACDDGNISPDDGCDEGCAVEDGFRCPPKGGACRPVVCGDRLVEAPESCDDGNATSGDGCSGACAVEEGYECPVPGVACQATQCGDGVVAGFEACDDAGSSGPGCDDSCQLEEGYACPQPGETCRETTCGDGVIEGTEVCDDGNLRPFDGCDPVCKSEPQCSGGVCAALCGDGVILPGSGEACDDGNTLSGDGCSAACEVEDGFTCEAVPQPLPDVIRLPVIYRDFRGMMVAGDPRHPDFDARQGSGITFDMVTDRLDGDRVPAWSGDVVGGSGSLSEDAFREWYRDGTRNVTVLDFLDLASRGGGTYEFASNAFFPLNGRGWDAPGSPAPERGGDNFSFTTETRYHFQFDGSERLDFEGDDDLWVFVDGQRCLDVGGLHSAISATMDLGNPAAETNATQRAIVQACADRLTVGRVYELAVFHAERRVTQSNFRLTLTGFVNQRSECEFECGDGVVTRFELCDDGAANNTGEYGRCGPDCRSRGPFCGDGIVEPGVEACDLGADANRGTYGGCNPDCTPGPFCGDGVRQGDEECDAGELNGSGRGCTETCVGGLI